MMNIEKSKNRISKIIKHLNVVSKSEVLDDELDQLYKRSEEIKNINENGIQNQL
jgi:hypothetical protein